MRFSFSEWVVGCVCVLYVINLSLNSRPQLVSSEMKCTGFYTLTDIYTEETMYINVSCMTMSVLS